MTDINAVLDADKRIEVGNYYVHKNDFPTSLSMFESVLDLDSNNVAALCNGAFLLMKNKQLMRAEHWVKQALGESPEHPHALGIYALISQESGEFAAARVLFEHSLRNEPNNVTTLLNYAYMLQLVGDYPRALEVYTKARDLNVMDVSTRFQRAMCLMTIAETPGQWAEALDEYELRHILYGTGNEDPSAGKPMYTGDPIPFSRSKLLIVMEQGVGDAVMMARYARYLKDNSVFRTIYVLCRPGQEFLMEMVEGVDEVFTTASSIPSFDYHVRALSLMRAELYPEIQPSNRPYLRRKKWTTEFPNRLPRVGICWQGNPEHGNDRWRSIGVDRFCDAFAGVSGVDLISLHQPEVSKHRPDFVQDVSIETLQDLANTIQDMDLVVTVDTAQLHIAGAFGVPTYALIPSNPDWRWKRNDPKTEWYPSVTLCRATEPLGWGPVLDRVRKGVDAFVEDRRSIAA